MSDNDFPQDLKMLQTTSGGQLRDQITAIATLRLTILQVSSSECVFEIND